MPPHPFLFQLGQDGFKVRAFLQQLAGAVDDVPQARDQFMVVRDRMTRTNDGQKQVTFIEIAGGKRVPFQGRKCAWYQPAQAKLLRDTDPQILGGELVDRLLSQRVQRPNEVGRLGWRGLVLVLLPAPVGGHGGLVGSA